MANINKIKAQGSIYDIEDTVARTSAVVVTSKPDGTVELQTPTSTVTVPSLTNFGDPSELENDVVTEISELKSDIQQNADDISAEETRAKAEEERLEELFTAPTQEAVDNWLNEHPEATTTVQDASLTPIKLNEKFNSELKSLSSFSGSTDAEKLYDALITKSYKGTILGGVINVESPISIPNATLREVKIANAIITLNDDMFTTDAEYAHIPSFVNCKFIGNGHAIFGGNYAVCGSFIGCVFDDCSLINKANGTVQSAYFAYCEVTNRTVPFIRANNLYDCRLDGMICEAQSQKIIDTSESTGQHGGPRSLWVLNSIFEGFTATVFDLAGGGPGVHIQNCYFEANTGGCLKLAKSADGNNYLSLEISGCKVNSDVTAFIISGFTNNYRVKASIHDNYYYTGVTGTPMVTGIPVDDPFMEYNNRPSYATDVICDTERYIYAPGARNEPTVNSTYLSLRAGGWVQVGILVFVDMVVMAKADLTGALTNAISGLPNSYVSNFAIPIVDANDGSSGGNELWITGTSGSFRGGMTTDKRYLIKGFYFTNNKTVR